MSSSLRRFEVLLPLRFNDGREVPPDWIAEAILEVVDQFGAASFETQRVEGHWRNGGVTYRDDSTRLVVDLSDTDESRVWMRGFKARWKAKLEQLELWVISYPIDLE